MLVQSKIRLLIASLAIVASGSTWAAPAEYFTELEINQIREAQEIERRVPVFLKIANTRLIHLGLQEREENKEGKVTKVAKALASVFQPELRAEVEKMESEAKTQFEESEAILRDSTRTQLLRGFYQAIEEAMDNIDDAYERKRGDVRRPLEDLKEFTEETIRLLKRFKPETSNEKSALKDALEQTLLALDGAKSALKIIPKTPKGN